MRVLFVGGHGHHYLRLALKAGLIEAVGMAGDGVDNDAAAKLPDRLGVSPRHFVDYRSALDELKPEVVSIGAVYAHNAEIVAESLERGIRVVSDKPIAATWEQLARLESLCDGDEKVLLTEFDLRSRIDFRAAYHAVREGLIGVPVLATAQKSYRFGEARPWFYKQRLHYGGTLLWIASHGIDAVRYVTGCELVHAWGHQGNLSRPDYGEFEDHVTISYILDNGGSALVHADYLRPAAAPSHGDDRLRVAGSEGLVECRAGLCTLMTQDQGPRDITDKGAEAEVGRDLVAALEGDTTYFSTAESLRAARALLASRDAADTGQPCAIVAC